MIKEKFTTKKLYESFYEVLKYSNFDIMKCLKIINKDIILKNIGSCILILFGLCYLVCLGIYIFQGISPL